MCRKLIYLSSFVFVLSMAGSTSGGLIAHNPSPADGAIHPDSWAALTWTAGSSATSHDVYFGENFDDVDAGTGGTFQGNQAATYFVVGLPGFPYPGGLVLGTTYYWRIDEVNPAKTYRGDVWSFTVSPQKAYNPSPPNGAYFVNPNVELSWEAGFGAKLHTVYFGDNFDDVFNATGGLPQGTKTYTPGPLELDKAYYWRVDEFDGIATYKGDVWSFTTAVAVHEGPIDIKPGSYPNAINLDSHGLIPVAILSDEEFDATTVDPSTIELAGASVVKRGKGNKFMAHKQDVNGDGLLDLVVQVATDDIDFSLLEEVEEDDVIYIYAPLTGRTYSGEDIVEGWDEITIVPPETDSDGKPGVVDGDGDGIMVVDIGALEDLIEHIQQMNLLGGIENSLVSKLENAIQSVDRGQHNAASNQLEAFINEVEAQRGKKITEEQADELIADAQSIIDDIEDNGT